MRKILIILLFGFLASGSLAQTYTYTYDAAGNRINVIILRRSKVTGQEIAAIQPATDAIAGQAYKIYPNPTAGSLTLQMPRLAENTKVICTIYSTSGTQVINSVLHGNERETLDLSAQPAGVYILRLTMGREVKVWKIVKE